ncbi:MAG: hypothetical protein IJ351_06890 [Oscillospiraceae bacterium]|nr:hypothetical protein [Oscillospiraceae bacterium]
MNKLPKRTTALLVSIVLILTVGVGSTLAYLVTNAGPVTNTFDPGEVPPTINEEFDENRKLKENVTVTNLGDARAYVRAAIVVTWKDKDGNVAPEVPNLDVDYDMSINTADWTKKHDGFYLYEGILEANGTKSVNNKALDTSTNLIQSAKQLKDGPDGYTLSIEILVQTVQAEGHHDVDKTPIKEAWGY